MENSMIENYEVLPNGLIKQVNIKKKLQTYNNKYVDDRYNTYGIKGHQMSGLRLGYLISSINKIPESILDVGYGNGDFLKLCSESKIKCYGNDISGYPLPSGVTFVNSIIDNYYEVICFFDVLEHFEDITFIKELNCKYVYVSVPWCHYLNDEWFENWRHRREDEHLWHFDDKSIIKFFNEMGYELLNKSNVEDTIRKHENTLENILTCIFYKKHD